MLVVQVVRALLYPEYLERWAGFSIRNIPSRHGSSSLVHRLSHALKVPKAPFEAIVANSF